MSAKNKYGEAYSHNDLPKIRNPFLYVYGCIMKILSIIFFGTSSIIVALIIFPIIRLFSLGKNKDFGITARSYISHVFRVFLGFLHIVGVSKLKIDDRKQYRNMHRKILIANHPSLLDFVYIMALVPNATCIVRGGLVKTPMGGVIKQAYITNTTNFDDILVDCKKLTDKGCNVIVFPEGTRTPRHGRNVYKRGAARIALYCGCDVQPFFIGGTDKYGLGKHDPFWSYNHVDAYIYDIKKLPEISIDEFKDLPDAVAAKHLTNKMEEVILAGGDEYYSNYTGRSRVNY